MHRLVIPSPAGIGNLARLAPAQHHSNIKRVVGARFGYVSMEVTASPVLRAVLAAPDAALQLETHMDIVTAHYKSFKSIHGVGLGLLC